LPSQTMATNTAIYARISSDPNGTALGVARQVEDCQALAARRGWAVGQVFVDNDCSATSRKPRPEYERMMAALRVRDLDALVVQAMSLGRPGIPAAAQAYMVSPEQSKLLSQHDYDYSVPDGTLIA